MSLYAFKIHISVSKATEKLNGVKMRGNVFEPQEDFYFGADMPNSDPAVNINVLQAIGYQ